jgi:hypothetical protein
LWNDPWMAPSKIRLWGPSWSKGRTAGHIFGREPSNDYFIKILFLLSKWFQTRRFVWIFSSETTGPIATKLLWNDPWMAPSKIVSGNPDFQPRWPPSKK